jgi:serine/threonine-protein kinase
MVGTPWFMSPEAIQNPAASDPRSDLYSVGGLAYYLLTGRHVFEHESAEEVIQDQLSSAPAPPSSVTTNPISAEMDAIILRCLEKDPANRPQSALELAALLMTSPHAHDSTPEGRANWWQHFHSRNNADAVPETTGDTTTLPDVKIDFDSRMES